MSNHIVGSVYEQIIEDVISSSRVDFEENGVDEAVLDDLRKVNEATTRRRCCFVPVTNNHVEGLAKKVDTVQCGTIPMGPATRARTTGHRHTISGNCYRPSTILCAALCRQQLLASNDEPAFTGPAHAKPSHAIV